MAAPMAESHSNNIVEVVIFYVDPTCFGQENKFIGGKERKRVSVKKTDVNVFRTFCSILKEQTGLVEEALQRGLGKEVEVKISRLEKTKEGVKTYGISTQATWELELEIEKGVVYKERIKKDQSKGPDLRHHEQVKSRQDTFARQVKAFCSVLEEMGNPFMEQSDDLLILDTRDIVDPRVAETVRKVEEIGKEQFNKFVTERLQSNTKSIYEPIKQNKLFMFSRQQPKTDSKEKQQISSLKQNCSLFSQLYVSCQVRNGDLVEFFRHENQAYPPSLSQFGELRHGSKSDLLVQLERITESVNEAPRVDALVIDGAALINMLKPRGSKTFESYCKDIVVPYIRGQLLSVRRIDMVWDEYIQDSLKASERSRRGKGIRRRVLPDSKVPGNWEAFLRVDENKKELFAYISEQLVSRDIVFDEEKQIVSTTGSNVNCRKEKDVRTFDLLSNEELACDVLSDLMEDIERFVILMYDKTSESLKVNEARKDLFTRKGRAIDNIPPTEAALLEHSKRACYMASQCWDRCLEPSPSFTDPGEWGWERNKSKMWVPFWTSLQEASACCNELIKCGCKNGCRGRCKCLKAMLSCTALCKCGGECDRD
ncbi:unnamed protein product [Mytilus edulis]|uniref:Tesmin/TSO1-like CXC domain-containing protein n=1 Tax=Mytilus edulis TaxID=6550 RepID=A0A8S3PY96_MYTED|nr:unnamed protein product [Mytilus edulis]